jgi:hypothetical protein
MILNIGYNVLKKNQYFILIKIFSNLSKGNIDILKTILNKFVKH